MPASDLLVRMSPDLSHFRAWENGIARVVEAYTRLLPEYGIHTVPADATTYDLHAVHAGTAPDANVCHCHGLYWTEDYQGAAWEHRANQSVITSIREAQTITVPSSWVAETFQRDMHLTPAVIPHGIDWQDWQGEPIEHKGYVLWNKNRIGDVCNPRPVHELARRFRSGQFITTFALTDSDTNIRVIGLQPRAEMKMLVRHAMLYLATTKETFGIGTLEALASGVPVLGFNHGGTATLVRHGINGYLAEPENYDDLAEGLRWCITHRQTLSQNARELAREWTWERAVEQVANLYRTMQPVPASIAVIIPCYNYGDRVGRAIRSVQVQTRPADEIIVIDDGSDLEQSRLTRQVCYETGVRYEYKPNGGVATARNHGVALTHSKYICPLDADDALAPQFLATCVDALERDRTLAIAYTGLQWIKADGSTGLSTWPGEWDYDAQLKRRNQIPTCAVMRREVWQRLGGQRQRFAPQGQGEEDADFWTRAGALGFRAAKVHADGLFIYSWLSGRASSNSERPITDWLAWNPWVADHRHPFASHATPVNSLAHPVRQYDRPVVSIIIPVGPGHAEAVVNALDSLEAQTCRQWEAVIVNDTGETWPETLRLAYPFAQVFDCGQRGTGRARNIGARHARAPFLLFLDADDWLYPIAINRMLEEWDTGPAIIYSDYTGKAIVRSEEIEKVAARLLYYNERYSEATFEMHSADFDCATALRQPDPGQPYIWCNITSLVPATWHQEIGGFDEEMTSWEDWDYWLRHAHAGKCFRRISEPLLIYRFHTGNRRERGLANYANLIQYLRQKYNTAETRERRQEAMVSGCGCNKGATATATSAITTTTQSDSNTKPDSTKGKTMIVQTSHRGSIEILDRDMVMAIYAPEKRGNAHVVGPKTGIRYGYRSGGQRFLVHRDDIAFAPHLFQAIDIRRNTPSAFSEPALTPPEPTLISSELLTSIASVSASVPAPILPEPASVFNPATIPGVTPGIAVQLHNIQGPEDLLALGHDGLLALRGVGETRARIILAWAREQLEK